MGSRSECPPSFPSSPEGVSRGVCLWSLDTRFALLGNTENGSFMGSRSECPPSFPSSPEGVSRGVCLWSLDTRFALFGNTEWEFDGLKVGVPPVVPE